LKRKRDFLLMTLLKRIQKVVLRQLRVLRKEGNREVAMVIDK
jgi:hypothetical protein